MKDDNKKDFLLHSFTIWHSVDGKSMETVKGQGLGRQGQDTEDF